VSSTKSPSPSRSAMIRKAASLPPGSDERREILSALSSTASGPFITEWTTDMSADYIIGGEVTFKVFSEVTVESIADALRTNAWEIAKDSGGRFKMGRPTFHGTSKGFRYAIRIQVTGVPMDVVVDAINDHARGPRKVSWGDLEWAF